MGQTDTERGYEWSVWVAVTAAAGNKVRQGVKGERVEGASGYGRAPPPREARKGSPAVLRAGEYEGGNHARPGGGTSATPEQWK